jgi:hypothetical protein
MRTQAVRSDTVGCTYVKILGEKYPSQQLYRLSSAIVCSKKYSRQYEHKLAKSSRKER